MKPTKNHVVPSLAIMMTSHPKQQVWLERTLESFEGCPYPIYLGYDDVKAPKQLGLYKSKGVYLTGRPAGQLGHAKGELFQMQMLIRQIKKDGYQFFYKTAGDCVHYRWRGFAEIHKMLLKNRWDLIQKGTSMIYGYTDKFHEIMETWTPKTRAGSAELFFGRGITESKARNLPLKAPEWERMLGRIHIQGEYALNQRIPVAETWKIGEIWF